MSSGEIHLDFFKIAFSFDVFVYSDNTSQTAFVNTFYFAEDNVRAGIKDLSNCIFSLNKGGRSWRE